jgi:3-phosphoinositide dependent protein kinase-1
MASTSEYWVGDAIGEGSFGVVVYGRHKTSDLHVAIKCVDKASLKRHPSQAIAIVQEQRILRRLKTQHQASSTATATATTTTTTSNCEDSFVVHLYASFHDAECVYLVLECCNGGTLQDLLDHYNNQRSGGIVTSARTMNMKVESTQYYGSQILEGMTFLHACNVIHCDMKPSNILLTDTGRIKIADFGCAIDNSNTGSNDAKESSKKPVVSSVNVERPIIRGTAAYSAPELNQQEDGTSAAVDLWSLGCILFACMFEKHQSPFDKGSEVGSIQAQKEYCDAMEAVRYGKLFGNDGLVTDEESKDNVEKKSPTLQAFEELIAGLLHPKADGRLTFAKTQQSDEIYKENVYPHIKGNAFWDETDMKQLRPDLLPPVPVWWTKSVTATTGATSPTRENSFPESNVLIDGATGWNAFLI